MDIGPSAPVTTESFRVFLNLNVNALDARPRFLAGEELSPGLYWNEATCEVERIEQPRAAAGPVVQLSRDPDVTYGRLIREVALGSGGRSGRPLPYVTD